MSKTFVTFRLKNMLNSTYTNKHPCHLYYINQIGTDGCRIRLTLLTWTTCAGAPHPTVKTRSSAALLIITLTPLYRQSRVHAVMTFALDADWTITSQRRAGWSRCGRRSVQ